MRLMHEQKYPVLIGVSSDTTGWYIEPDFDSSYKIVKMGRGWDDSEFLKQQQLVFLACDKLFDWEEEE